MRFLLEMTRVVFRGEIENSEWGKAHERMKSEKGLDTSVPSRLERDDLSVLPNIDRRAVCASGLSGGFRGAT